MAKKIHVTEDEQLARVRKWWNANGTSIVTGVVLGLVLIFGYNWWQKHQQSLALQASEIFSELLQANEAEDIDKLEALATQLKNDYGKHDYAAKGLVLTATSQLKAGKVKEAKENLSWVIENSKLTDNQLLASYKLARQLYREGAYDEALELVDIEQKSGFASQYFELIGDIYHKKADLEKAQDAYLKAMELLPPASAGSGYSEILQLKINNTAQ